MTNPLAIDVVSIQSQVVYGQVGNNSAVPTLQAHGLRVAAVPTVVLSNTPHYPSVHGGALPTDWFAGYLEDLHARGALRQLRAVLVGYLGGPAQAAALRDWLETMLAGRPEVRVLLDPVIGDHDVGMYVDPGMVEAYRRDLLPLADGLLPNGFELARLSAMPVDDIDAVVVAARSLLVGRTRWVVVTSAAPATWADEVMRVAVVTRDMAEVIEHPRFDTTPKGTGDLFSATLAARLLAGETLPDATRGACDRVLQVLACTREAGCDEMLLFPDGATT